MKDKNIGDKKDIVEYGYTSCCDTDFVSILMWDFDGNIRLKDIIKSLSEIQRKYVLSEIYIIKTRNGYHAVCLDKFKFIDALNIISNTRFIDKTFIKISRKRNHFVHRIGDDRKLVWIIYPRAVYYSCICRREKSNAHRILLEKMFHIEIRKDKFFDKNTIAKCVVYAR